MKRSSLWGAWLTAVVLAVLSVSAALAAPPAQDEPTVTVTPTPSKTPFGPTWTPTPTLLPIPEGAGRVKVSEAAIRVAPSLDRPVLDGLEYGDLIQPFARSANGNWVAIFWEGDIGWVVASLIEWHPNFEPQTLPVYVPSTTLTPVVLLTATSIPVPSETAGPPSPTVTPRPSETSAPPLTETPFPTLSLQPTEPGTPIPAVVALPTEPLPTQQRTGSSRTMPPVALPGPWLWLLIGVPVSLTTLFYGWRLVAGQRELGRYSDEFPVQICPACQIGILHLEESIRRSLGIAHVTRTVRCDACRSVLRQIEPGVWRYSVDPVVNPSLAEDYNGRHLSDTEFEEIAQRAAGDYQPTAQEQPTAHQLTDEEILAELEARVAQDETQEAEDSISTDLSSSPPEPPPAQE